MTNVNDKIITTNHSDFLLSKNVLMSLNYFLTCSLQFNFILLIEFMYIV